MDTISSELFLQNKHPADHAVSRVTPSPSPQRNTLQSRLASFLQEKQTDGLAVESRQDEEQDDDDDRLEAMFLCSCQKCGGRESAAKTSSWLA